VAVVSEPPWLNIGSGTAARNGTTSHTISFGFTSTSGSLLVAVIHGAVTHTASGWTEQAQPVATGECSLFTKTSAGDSSITVTHNGSNYPVNYVIYEFPTGSTVTGVDSTTGSNDTMEGLTGLPGTEQVIIGALGRVAIGSETGASISPSAPWVEDADLFVAASGTDGSYLAVVHQINYTGASITPTISPTYTGTWSNGSREKISAAFDVAAASAPVTGAAALAATATLAAGGDRTAVAAAATTATATIAAGVVGTRPAQAASTSTAALTAGAARTAQSIAALPAAVTLTTAASVTKPAIAGLAATATLAAGADTGTAPQTAAAALSITAAMTAGAARTQPAGIAVAAIATLAAASQRTAVATAPLAASATLTAGAIPVRPAAVAMSALATLAASATSGGKITYRPSAGTTARPFAGITLRP
jgi:hypothetical protein